LNNFLKDDEIVMKVEKFGYPKEYLIKCLKNNELNYATTTYYLLKENDDKNISL